MRATKGLHRYFDGLLAVWYMVVRAVKLLGALVGLLGAHIWFSYRKITYNDQDRTKKRQYLSKIYKRPKQKMLVAGDPNYPISPIPDEVVIAPPDTDVSLSDFDIVFKVHRHLFKAETGIFMAVALYVLSLRLVVASLMLYGLLWKVYLSNYAKMERPDILLKRKIVSLFGRVFDVKPSVSEKLGMNLHVNTFGPGLMVVDILEGTHAAARSNIEEGSVLTEMAIPAPPVEDDDDTPEAEKKEPEPLFVRVNQIEEFELRVLEAQAEGEEFLLVKTAGGEALEIRFKDRPTPPPPIEEGEGVEAPDEGFDDAAGVQVDDIEPLQQPPERSSKRQSKKSKKSKRGRNREKTPPPPSDSDEWSD